MSLLPVLGVKLEAHNFYQYFILGLSLPTTDLYTLVVPPSKTLLIDNLINTLSSFLLLARPHTVLNLFRSLGA